MQNVYLHQAASSGRAIRKATPLHCQMDLKPHSHANLQKRIATKTARCASSGITLCATRRAVIFCTSFTNASPTTFPQQHLNLPIHQHIPCNAFLLQLKSTMNRHPSSSLPLVDSGRNAFHAPLPLEPCPFPPSICNDTSIKAYNICHFKDCPATIFSSLFNSAGVKCPKGV